MSALLLNQAQQPAQAVIASPINDVQLVAVLATQVDGVTIADRVETAQDILAEALVKHGRFQQIVHEKRG